MTVSLFPLGATIISLLYALNQKERQFCMEARRYDPHISQRRRTERESMRSLIEESQEEDSLILKDNEMIRAIG
jgi:hypothetical protein